MKITKAKLKQIIKEELETVMEGELDEVAERPTDPQVGSPNWCEPWLPVLAKLEEEWNRVRGSSMYDEASEELAWLSIIRLGKELKDAGCVNLPERVQNWIKMHDSPQGKERFGEVAYKTAPGPSIDEPVPEITKHGFRWPK